MLARQFNVLTARGGQSPGGETGDVSHVAAAQPLDQAGLAEPAQPSRAGLLGEQSQRSFLGSSRLPVPGWERRCSQLSVLCEDPPVMEARFGVSNFDGDLGATLQPGGGTISSLQPGDLFYEELIASYVDDPRFVERPWLTQRLEQHLADPGCRTCCS
jgi:hypothetical protein